MSAYATLENCAPRQAAAAVASAALHGVVLLLCAATSVRLVHHAEPEVIPLVIRDTASLPAPSGGAPRQPASILGPTVPVAAAVEPKSAGPAGPSDPRKRAAKPKPAPAATTSVAKPPTELQPSAEAAAADSATSAAPLTNSAALGDPGAEAGELSGAGRDGRGRGVLRPDQVASPPTVLQAVRPVRPPAARARGQEGVVLVQGIIDQGGAIEPDSLRIVESHPPFDQAALDAFRRWRFRPGRDENGAPVRVLIEQPFRFKVR